MKKATLSFISLVAVVFLVSCGGGSSSNSRPTTTGLSKRVFLTNQFFGSLTFIDAIHDVFGLNLISFGSQSQPTILATQTGKKTLVFLSGSNSVAIVDNASETNSGTVALPAATESMAVSTDGTRGYVAVHNTSQLVVIDLDNKGIVANITTNLPWRKLVVSPDGTKIAGFTDTTDAFEIVPISVVASTCSATAVCTIGADTSWKKSVGGGLERPVNGVFSADNTTLYVMNCGDECGGSTSSAGVAAFNIAAGTTGATTSTPTPATIGLLDGGNLYVAGTPVAWAGQLNGGVITKLNPANLTSCGGMCTANLPDGLHDTMAAQAGKIFVGARGCNGQLSCLGIYNPTANTTQIDVIDPVQHPEVTPGDVTGMTAISGRTVVYVAVGGELRIYEAGNSALTGAQLDIVGKAVDVKLVD